ncbi:photosystem II reaction center protein PsbZ [Acaryochloris sp. IP29b_bin.148]|uniref:photosystem II reaction center protein PsbZ n=1 Tax=Acaryochloris sp. IP29b_bin.148 TaxID=2969218 RepID=UPI002611839B|nr:photosystem II reaction center protein PsbZ [Acaryochloris sp. IP29b_bin.148]
MSVLFQLLIAAFVALSFALVIGVPVVFSTDDGSGDANKLLWGGAFAWIAIVLVAGILSPLVV